MKQKKTNQQQFSYALRRQDVYDRVIYSDFILYFFKSFFEINHGLNQLQINLRSTIILIITELNEIAGGFRRKFTSSADRVAGRWRRSQIQFRHQSGSAISFV